MGDMKGRIREIVSKLKASAFVKDSFWAISGNGLGSALMLLAGILIARFLGKDLYGEYGMVKTTMFYFAAFSTFGLGYTSTKFIAEYIQRDGSKLRGIIRSSYKITLCVSVTLCILLILFARPLAVFIKAPQMVFPFRYLGLILICRAVSTVGAGVLGGFKAYRTLGINNTLSGALMLMLSVPLTYWFGLKGSLFSLLASQLLISVLNTVAVVREIRKLPVQSDQSFDGELMSFSFPVAIQELTYALANWGSSLLLARFASLGEVGIYSACSQWNAIILFIPGLLGNVVLSYLSSSAATDAQSHHAMLRRMLLVNLVCAAVPFLAVLLFSPLIVSLYGPTFLGMRPVLNVLIFSTIFTCLSSVFMNELIARGKNWVLFSVRVFRDIAGTAVLYTVLKMTGGAHAALNYAFVILGVSIVFLLFMYLAYHLSSKEK